MDIKYSTFFIFYILLCLTYSLLAVHRSMFNDDDGGDELALWLVED